jgi:uncharacterized protein Yka (UPF0111/DUF47 family)/8-oxo-dGTP pyrophosphatase MutT (NUDIX family)
LPLGIVAIRQVAALPYRIEPDGRAQVMLITSREQRRWVVPKGNTMAERNLHEAAAVEAFEEAGVSGIPCPTALGEFRYLKRRRDGTTRNVTVAVFPLAFQHQADDWPEREERETRWFGLTEAAAAVDEPELKHLITNFRVPPAVPGLAQRVWPTTQRTSREKFPMMRWFQSLMPQQGRFFELFEAHAATLVGGADALALLLQGGDTIPANIAEISRREHQADDITREVLLDVRRIFVTPFDRSAITDLIGVMDDAIDQMNATGKTIALYELTEFEPQMRDMSGIIVEAARVTAETIPLLRHLNENAGRLHELTARLIQLEGHADDIHEAGLKALFKRVGKTQPMDFIIGQEVYSHLERIVDKFEDIANEVQGLVIDHA